MLKELRQTLTDKLWQSYCAENSQMRIILQQLQLSGIEKINLDHFAMIDLPGPNSGIAALEKIFSALGYCVGGTDYLADKQNDFLWLTEEDSLDNPAKIVLPQAVVADFRLDELPSEVRKIIYCYAMQSPPFDMALFEKYLREKAAEKIMPLLLAHFSGRQWPLPTVKEFQCVQAFNELLAWVLVFGRKPNHFTLSIHLMDCFPNLESFHAFVSTECNLALNLEGSDIKGGKKAGIAQGSTRGIPSEIQLADGKASLPLGFVEFVWRYPLREDTAAYWWSDYFTGFIANHADNVIESLYAER